MPFPSKGISEEANKSSYLLQQNLFPNIKSLNPASSRFDESVKLFKTTNNYTNK